MSRGWYKVTNQAGSEYRHDIDGLRAFAVMGVILHHCGVALVGSGYAGVDVFFVISGFLITRNLVAESAGSGGVSLVDFWARRIRRLVPALALPVSVDSADLQSWSRFDGGLPDDVLVKLALRDVLVKADIAVPGVPLSSVRAEVSGKSPRCKR